MKKLFISGMALGLLLFSAGCVSLLPETAPAAPRYDIAPAPVAGLSGAPVDWSLAVEDPRAVRVYDTTRIAVSTAPGRIEYYSGAEWADRAPRLFQVAVVETFQDTDRILAVGDRGAIPVADIVLQTDIRRMELEMHGANGEVVVSVFARLGDGKGKIYAARLFDATTPVGSQSAADVTAAFSRAFSSAITDLVGWTYEEGGAMSAASRS